MGKILYPQVPNVVFKITDKNGHPFEVDRQSGRVNANLEKICEVEILTDSQEILPIAVRADGKITGLPNWDTSTSRQFRFPIEIFKRAHQPLTVKSAMGRLQVVHIQPNGIAVVYDCGLGIYGTDAYLLGSEYFRTPVYRTEGVVRQSKSQNDSKLERQLMAALNAQTGAHGLLSNCQWRRIPHTLPPQAETRLAENTAKVVYYRLGSGEFGEAECWNGERASIERSELPDTGIYPAVCPGQIIRYDATLPVRNPGRYRGDLQYRLIGIREIE